MSKKLFKFGSVCSGIEAASKAWHPLGWHTEFVSEIEPFACEVLKNRWPKVPNFGDINKFKRWKHEKIDLLVGGTPCQSFSVAGLREGLDDPRGRLALVYLALVRQARPRWVVWENVPGVLTVKKGRVFGSFLGALEKLGYGWAYGVRDAQFFGVPQRRRRVFVVGYLGDWRRAAAVLFERYSLSGHPPPSQKAGQEVTGTLASRSSAGGGLGTDFNLGGGLVSKTLMGKRSDSCDPTLQTYIAHVRKNPIVLEDQGGSVMSVHSDGVVGTLRSQTHGHEPSILDVRDLKEEPFSILAGQTGANGLNVKQGTSYTLDRSSLQAVATKRLVRRLTPRECERLQGFPDDYTLIPYRGKSAAECPDGPRYKALGNSMAVPVMHWIGQRIQMVENLRRSRR